MASSQNSRNQVRVVPWTGLPEWHFVSENIFDDKIPCIDNALLVASMWVKRGNVPPAIESTVNILKLKRYFESEKSIDATSLRLALSSALVRFVNEVVDPNQRASYALPISMLAEQAGIPRLLVDIRHSATHNELPGLELLSYGADMALEWLREYYWEAQTNFEDNVIETTIKMMERYKEGLKDCHPLTKPPLNWASKCWNDIPHVEYSSEIQKPALRTILESKLSSSEIYPLIESISQKDETSIVRIIEIFLQNLPDPTLMEDCLKIMSNNIKSAKTIVDCAYVCLKDPALDGRKLFQIIIQKAKCSIPDKLQSLLSILTSDPIIADANLTISGMIEKANMIMARSVIEDLPDGWSTPKDWRPLPFGVTETFNPIHQFKEFIIKDVEDFDL